MTSRTAIAAVALGFLLVSALVFSPSRKPSSSMPNNAASSSSSVVDATRPLATTSSAAWRLNQGLVLSSSDDGLSVSFTKPQGEGSAKHGAMYLGQGSHLRHKEFTFRIDSGEQIWIGWVRPSKFKEGWGTRALEFGGNLADGAGLLRADYGPRAKKGDVVSTRAELVENGSLLRVSFAVNGQDLGPAFEIDGDLHAVGELFPFLSFTDTSGRITVLPEGYVPPPPPPQPQPPKNIKLGKWEAVGTASPVALTILPSSDGGGDEERELFLVFKVANTIRIRIEKENGLLWKAKGPAMSTMMMPHGPAAEVERKVNALLGDGVLSIREVEGAINQPVFLEISSATSEDAASTALYFKPAQHKPSDVVKRSEIERVLQD